MQQIKKHRFIHSLPLNSKEIQILQNRIGTYIQYSIHGTYS